MTQERVVNSRLYDHTPTALPSHRKFPNKETSVEYAQVKATKAVFERMKSHARWNTEGAKVDLPFEEQMFAAVIEPLFDGTINSDVMHHLLIVVSRLG
jgi:hypothetical protein